jgi:acyl homoserine lactone synthase
MWTSIHEEGRLSEGVGNALARYRHQIFVEQLGWDLPIAEKGFERDQYDHDDTVYVLAHDEMGSICGCARLLPTTLPYLLKDVFPFLFAERMSAPESPEVWELSRFAASPSAVCDAAAGNADWVFQPMLASVVRCAARLGARQLIGVTYLGMERLFRRIGVHVHRAGPVRRIEGRRVLACWIDIDSQTLSALGIDAVQEGLADEFTRAREIKVLADGGARHLRSKTPPVLAPVGSNQRIQQV